MFFDANDHFAAYVQPQVDRFVKPDILITLAVALTLALILTPTIVTSDQALTNDTIVTVIMAMPYY